jgi:hypothetical protein
MNYRKAILRDLYKFYEIKGPNNYAMADTLKTFKPGDYEYLNTLNQLLGEGLILGVEGPHKRVAITLNPNNLIAVKKELRSWYQDPRFWIGTIIAAAGIIVAILAFLLK